ncbi:hypothetical protein [Anaerotignum sp.]|uniref:hypothetical protein n=1 Tax=Anaerotignum sp. TaxID=2039241 RepID=UPI00373548EE
MKKKKGLMCLLLAAAMIFCIPACSKDGEGTSAEVKDGITVNATLWDLVYDDKDGWTYVEDDFYNDKTTSKIIMTIPKEEGEGSIVTAQIRVAVEEPYSFRDYLTSYGFDEYEYAVNESYDVTEIGGVACLKSEGDYWGSSCLRYLNRVEGAGATVLIEITGEYEDERVDKLLSGLTIKLEDTGNVDGPWAWEGEPFSAEPRSVMVGTYTLNSQWLPITDCIVTKETFKHKAAANGNQVYLMVNGELKRYDFDGTSLKFAEDIALDTKYEDISVDTNGQIWLSNFMEPLISWKDGAKTASYEGPDHVAMHPSGTWGISWFSGPECEKITLTGGAMKTEPMVFKETDSVRMVMIDENHIYVGGSDVSDGSHKVFVYDTAGNLQMTLADSDGGSLGSITFITETANGYLALDGNMREVVLWTKDGTYIGAADDGDLFGTNYPWFCSGTKLDDGSILAIMTEKRADKSAQELVAYKLSGF